MKKNENENLNQPKESLEITEKILGGAYTVSNFLGCGFLEKVYYKDVLVGEYAVDLLVKDRILVELKAVQGLDDVHYAQCLNYLRATGLNVCLLLNFGKPKLQIRRVSARKEWANNN